jgi:osmotically-inducible protein OsmY
MGLVTQQEAAAATDQARQVSGVQRIVKLFEYLD